MTKEEQEIIRLNDLLNRIMFMKSRLNEEVIQLRKENYNLRFSLNEINNIEYENSQQFFDEVYKFVELGLQKKITQYFD